MLKFFTFLMSALFLVSCSSTPSVEQTAETSCEAGDCSKNFTKLAGPVEEQPVTKPAPKKKNHKRK